MPRKSSIICYFGCASDGGPLHVFPNSQEERFNSWKTVIHKTTLERGDKYLVNSVRICDRHFEQYYKLPSRRLTRNAIPTLNIDINPMQMHSKDISLLSEPSTSTVEPIATLSTSPMQVNEIGESLAKIPKLSKPKRSLHQTKTKFMSSKTIVQLLDKIKEMRQKLKYKNNEIILARKFISSNSFLQTIKNLPDAAQILFKMQLQGKKQARGRRFSNKEKIMALSIFKQSPKTYKILQSMFILPSKRTLQLLLSDLVVKPGIDNPIIKKLNKIAAKLSDEKKMVNLLFDEVALAPGLFYDALKNEIIGFEDFGFKKTNLIANHALVFMLKGIKSKKKQPICFTFCQSTTKKEVLKILLLNIIKEVHNSGMTIVSTICDQCTTNVSVIKDLVEETNNKYKNEGKQPTMCFEIENMKIFPLFDSPHLLKGVRNNFLIKNAIFIQDGKEKLAKWEHIQMLFNIDVGEDEIRLVNKLTENHVNKDKIKKMKVKLAAQGFSQRV